MSVGLWHETPVWNASGADPLRALPLRFCPTLTQGPCATIAFRTPTHRRGKWRFSRPAPHAETTGCGGSAACRGATAASSLREHAALDPSPVPVFTGPRRERGGAGRARPRGSFEWGTQLAVGVAGGWRWFPSGGQRAALPPGATGHPCGRREARLWGEGWKQCPQLGEWAVSGNKASARLPQLCRMFWKRSEGRLPAAWGGQAGGHGSGWPEDSDQPDCLSKNWYCAVALPILRGLKSLFFLQ